MLTFLGRRRSYCDGISRRDFLRVGALTVGGLSMADLLRLKAQAATGPTAGKSVIMVFLHGGPTQMDTYDMKPEAPVEFRGEFRPIHTNVPGMDICELMPRQAQIMDKLAILRGLHFVEEHSAHSLWTGYPERISRPAFGSVVSYFKGKQDGLPPYVSLMNRSADEDPAYVGTAHRPFVPTGPGLENLGLVAGVSLDRLADRKQLLSSLDTIRRDIDYRGALAGLDAYTVRALDMVASSKTREAFDINREPTPVREKYGKANEDFLRARRLVEAGISVVTLVVGGWDTHGNNFNAMRGMLPNLDQGIHALVSDLHQRGLGKDVAVVVWGEFGRTPRVNKDAGRDHWGPAASLLFAGAGARGGLLLGQTDRIGAYATRRPVAPADVACTIYDAVGVDPHRWLMHPEGRPIEILDGGEPVRELFA